MTSLPLVVLPPSFFPTDQVKKNKMAVCERNKDRTLNIAKDGVAFGRSMNVDDVPTQLLSGGSGLFGTQKDYLKLLRSILRSNPAYNDTSDTPRRLSAESYRELFFGCVPLEHRADLAGRVDRLLRGAGSDYSVGFSVSLTDLQGRRKAGSGYWAGLAKTMFWIDPKSGIAVCSMSMQNAEGR